MQTATRDRSAPGMASRGASALPLINASYAPGGSDAEWMARLLALARPMLGPAGEAVGWTFRRTSRGMEPDSFSEGTSRSLVALVRRYHALAPLAALDLVYRDGNRIDTASALAFRRFPQLQQNLLTLSGGRARDLLLVSSRSSGDAGVAIGALLENVSRVSAQERRRWPHIAAHMGAGLRLRTLARALATRFTLSQIPPAAWETCSWRDAVRRAARIDSEPASVARATTGQHWDALIDGRGSLLDRFDACGYRFVVAAMNDPAYRDPRALTERERAVADLLGSGHSSKELAFLLRIPEAAVTHCIAVTREKLGLRSRVELVGFFARDGLRRRLVEVTLAGERLLVGAYPLVDADCLAALSDCERDVVAHLAAGATNAGIASIRGSSERTIANQLQSAFRKLGVRSRAELVAKLQRGARSGACSFLAVALASGIDY